MNAGDLIRDFYLASILGQQQPWMLPADTPESLQTVFAQICVNAMVVKPMMRLCFFFFLGVRYQIA